MDRHEKWFEKSNDCLYIEGGREGRKNLRGVVKSWKGGVYIKKGVRKIEQRQKCISVFITKTGLGKRLIFCGKDS